MSGADSRTPSLRLIVALAVCSLLGAGVAWARASPLRRLAPSVTSFATDGIRYAVWQPSPVSPIVIFDTYTRTRRAVEAPGCVLENEAPREDPEPVAGGGGRFLVSCFKEPRAGCFIALGRNLLRCGEKLAEETAGEKESRAQTQRLLSAQTDTSIPLPEGFDWTRVAASYVEATLESHPTDCRALYDIATGRVTLSSTSQICDRINRLGVSEPVCSALRRKVLEDTVTRNEGSAYQNGLLVHPSRNGRTVQLERCHGRPTTLPAPVEPPRHITFIGPGHRKTTQPLSPGEPNNFDLRDGLLTWSNGFDPTDSSPFEDAVESGTLTSYQLATRRRRTWKLPSIPLYTGEEPPPSGVFGYSAHTLNTVFWIAARDMSGGEAGLCCVESSYLYAARY
jgi:hypothetical protein